MAHHREEREESKGQACVLNIPVWTDTVGGRTSHRKGFIHKQTLERFSLYT